MNEALDPAAAQRAERRARRQRRAQAAVFVTPRARVVRCLVHGEPVFFTVANPRDEIQRHHIAGRFYEEEELAIIARHFPLGGRFLDIGANVGNHSVFVGRLLRAARIVPLEPNPEAVALLLSNLHLNGLEGRCDLRFLGIGLSDRDAENQTLAAPRRNLGGARLRDGGGDIALRRGDELLAGEAFDLIKIDVEGMEMAVLSGLEGIVRACRPKLFVEVDNANGAAFEAWLATVDYRIAESHRRYARNTNHLVVPAA